MEEGQLDKEWFICGLYGSVYPPSLPLCELVTHALFFLAFSWAMNGNDRVGRKLKNIKASI